MDTITVDKNDLITKLTENRTNHRAAYEEAVEVYRREAAAMAEKQVELLLSGRIKAIVIDLPVPEEHTEDYDRTISMLEWDQADTVDLDRSEFAQYVQDNWGWARAFWANSVSYTAGARQS